MSEGRSRRDLLGGLSAAVLGGFGGCLRLTGSDTAATGNRTTTAEATTGTDGAADSAQTTDTEGATDTPQTSSITEAWELPEWGSDVVAFEGTFYASTWVSKQVYAVAPDGSVQWKTDEVGKFKHDSLAVADSLVVGCAYGGQITAFDRETGEIRWNFADGRYDSWSAGPLVTERYVVAANRIDDLNNSRDTVVYVLDRDSGETVETVEYRDIDSRIDSVGVVDGRLYVSSWNHLDLFDLDALTKDQSHDEGLFGTNYVRDGDLFVATDDNVYRYAVEGSDLEQLWGQSLRGRVDDLRITDESVFASGDAGVFKLTRDGSEVWWTQTDARAGRPAIADDSAVVMDEFLQLYAFDGETGEQTGTVELPSEGTMAPTASIDRTVLTGVDPLTAYRID